MQDQHKLIKGYRDLSQAEIDLMNEIKAKGAELEALCDKVKVHIKGQRDATVFDPNKLIEGGQGTIEAQQRADEKARLDRADPEYWEYSGRSGLQTALMMLTRAVAQPTNF